MDAVEFQEWVAYFDCGDPLLDLLAEQKQDLRTGIVASTVANCLASGRRRFTPSDFAAKWNTGQEPARQSPQDMVSAARRIAAAFANRKK